MSPRRALLLFALLVPVFNLITVLALPQAVNQLVMHRIVKQALREDPAPSTAEAQARKAEVLARQGINVALPAPRADASARTVVRPSPDLLYTACVFDLSRGPLHLTAPVPESYLSVSGFAADTSNFFALNDGDFVADASGKKRVDVLLTRTPIAAAPGTRVVLAPSTRGLVLFRTLITDEAAQLGLQREFQSQQRCDPEFSPPGGIAPPQ